MDYQLDLTDYTCPLPLLMTKKAVALLKTGETLQLFLNKQSSINDFIQLADAMGLSITLEKRDKIVYEQGICILLRK